MRVITRALLVVLYLTPSAAGAYPTCLNIVPTAETVGAGSASLQWEADSSNTPFDGRSSHAVYTQWGLSSRWEIGLDAYEVDGQPALLANAKCVLLPEARGLPGVAAGFWSLGRHSQGEPYVVASRSSGSLGITMGLARVSRRLHPVGGAAMGLNDNWSIQADFQANREGFVTLGTSYSVSGSVGITLYHSRCTDRGAEGDFSGLNLAWQPALSR